MVAKKFPSDADFDAWSDESAEKVFAELAESAQVKWLVTADGKFYGRFPDGYVIGLPLKMTLAQLDEINTAGAAPVDQLKMLFTLMGLDKEAEDANDRDLTEMVKFAELYFAAFEKKQQATMGE